MKSKQILITISWAAVIIWMALIFKFSSQPSVQSVKLSTGITQTNIRAIEKVKPKKEFNIYKFDHLIRKNAHFFIYLVLGLLVLNALRRSGVSGFRCAAYALLICILYAASDEIHQVFVPGRGALIKDVIIDSSGACLGILIMVPGTCKRMLNQLSRTPM